MIAFFKYAFIAFILVAFALIFLFGFKSQPNNIEKILTKFSTYQKITVVSPAVSNEFRYIRNGEHFYYNFLKSNEDDALNFILNHDYEGIVLQFSENLEIDYFKTNLNFNLSSAKEVENMNVYYGYLPEFDNFVINNGKKVNVQLAKTENGWVMGMPLILTGF